MFHQLKLNIQCDTTIGVHRLDDTLHVYVCTILWSTLFLSSYTSFQILHCLSIFGTIFSATFAKKQNFFTFKYERVLLNALCLSNAILMEILCCAKQVAGSVEEARQAIIYYPAPRECIAYAMQALNINERCFEQLKTVQQDAINKTDNLARVCVCHGRE